MGRDPTGHGPGVRLRLRLAAGRAGRACPAGSPATAAAGAWRWTTGARSRATSTSSSPAARGPEVFVAFLDAVPEPGAACDGLAFPVDAAALGELDARERNYRRVEVDGAGRRRPRRARLGVPGPGGGARALRGGRAGGDRRGLARVRGGRAGGVRGVRAGLRHRAGAAREGSHARAGPRANVNGGWVGRGGSHRGRPLPATRELSGGSTEPCGYDRPLASDRGAVGSLTLPPSAVDVRARPPARLHSPAPCACPPPSAWPRVRPSSPGSRRRSSAGG